MTKKRNTMKLKSFRMRPNTQLTIALVCDNLEITESDFIRESISNQLLRIKNDSMTRTAQEDHAIA